MPEETVPTVFERAIARRSLLRGAALGSAGLAAAALIGCGSKKKEAKTAAPAASGTAQVAAKGVGELVKDDALPYPYQFPEPAKTAKAGGVMVFGVNSDISVFDPTKATASGTGRVVNMVYNRLLGINRGIHLHPFKMALEPELAKSWERSPDGMVFTFNIRDDVKWQNLPPLNGRAFTAADVKFAFDRYKAGGVSTSYWVNADKIDAPDAKTLKITMKKPTADFLLPLGAAYQTIHPKELVDDGSIEKKVIGTGPMILKDAKPSEKVTFDKNPNFFERKVLLDGVELRFLPDTAARLAAFRAGQIDYGDLIVSALTDVKALLGSNAQTQVNMTPTLAGQPFAMNLSNPKFADIRVRRAISMAIDRKEFLAIVYQGLGKILPIFPWLFVFDKEPTVESLGQWHQYNPDEAKKLLQAAGQEKLTLENKYYNYSSAYDQLAEVHTAQFKKVGITLTGGKSEYTEFNSQWTGRKLPEVSSGGWVTIGFDADNYFYNVLHSKAAGNRWNLNDPKVDELAEKQQLELDPEKRKAILKQIWDYDLDQAYHPVVPSGTGFHVYQPWTRGIRFGGAMGTSNNYQDIGDEIAEAWLDK